MAEVTPRVIIEVETRQKRSRLEAPDATSTERTFKAQADAAERASQSVERNAEVVRRSSASMLNSFREAGEGAFRFGRGLALLSANGSDDLKRLVQSVALAQGAFDVFAGGSKVFTSLAGVLGGPVAVGITGVTTALGAGAIAWNKWKAEAEAAAKAVEEARKAAMEFERESARGWERQQQREGASRNRRSEIAGFRLDAALTPESRASRLTEEQARLTGEFSAIDRDRDRRLRGFRPSDFRGGASEAFGALLRFGSTSDLTIARDAELRRQEVAENQLAVTRQQYDLQKEQIEASRRALTQGFGQLFQGAFGQGAFGGITTLNAADAAATFASQFNRRDQELLQRTEQSMNKIIDVIERAAQKADEIDRRLNQGPR
jgi:hypothetical protein